MMKYYTSFRPGHHDFDYAKRAVQAGLTGFEAVYWESYLTSEVYQEYLECVKRIKGELGAGFTVHGPITDIHLGSLNQKMREAAFEEIRGSLRFARAIGASLVVFHPAPGILAMPGGEWSKQDYHLPRKTGEMVRQEEYLVRAVKDLADYAPDLLIGLENLVFPHELYRSPVELQELIRKVNRSNVGLTLDVGHAAVCGQKPMDFLNLLADEVFHVHLHDNHGAVDEHLPLGEGVIDYVAVVQSLKKLDYQGVVNLEFSLDNPDGYSDYLYQFR